MSDMLELSVFVCDATSLVTEAAERHKTSPTATAALGRTLIGTLLLAAFRKDDEVVQVSLKGDGPLGGVLAIADTRGFVKGAVGNSNVDPPLHPGGKLNVGAAVGEGVLSVVRTHPLEPNPYTGFVPLVSGEVAEDLAQYLSDSEQTNTALGLGVSVRRDLSVNTAGGFMVQVLPFCSDATLTQLESNLGKLPSMTSLLEKGLSPTEITALILEGIGEAVNQESIVPRYGPCDAESLRGRMMRAVASLGAAEVRSIMEDEGKIEVTCEMCAETYQFEEDDVLELTTR